jgi:hypothetical protein
MAEYVIEMTEDAKADRDYFVSGTQDYRVGDSAATGARTRQEHEPTGARMTHPAGMGLDGGAGRGYRPRTGYFPPDSSRAACVAPRGGVRRGLHRTSFPRFPIVPI